MIMQRTNGTNHEEENVTRLLSYHGKSVSMPPQLKEQMHQVVLSRAEQRAPERFGMLYRLLHAGTLYPLAAATALLIGLLVIWPWLSPTTIAWADVVEQIAAATSLSARTTSETALPSGETRTEHGWYYSKDPGRIRMERYAAPLTGPGRPAEAEEITLSLIATDKVVTGSFIPADKRGAVLTIRYTGVVPERLSAGARNLASFAWQALATLTADQTKRIGEQMIGDVRAVGFEASAAALIPPGGGGGQGTARAWASAETGTLLAVEVELEDPNAPGVHMTQRLDLMQWDVDIPDTMFDPESFSGYQLQRQQEVEHGFTSTSLRPRVRLRVSNDQGTTMLTETDVVSVDGMQTTRETSSRPSSAGVWMTIAEKAAQRCCKLAGPHQLRLNEKVTVDLDGKTQLVGWISGVSSNMHLFIDVTPLAMTPAMFEEHYLQEPAPGSASS